VKVDNRAGSERLIPYLRDLGVSVEPGILPAGDVEILGNGPDGPLLIGCEHKVIEDVVACMRDGRFAEQARAMADYYNVRWLCVEGELAVGSGGLLSVRRGSKWFELPGKVRYQELASWLLTMVQCGGTLLQRTKDKPESALWLRSLELWWTAKEWEDHRAHQDWYTPPGIGNPFKPQRLVVRAAALLPGIGVGRAEKVGDHFGTMKKMCCNSQEEWVKIPGVGKVIAAKVVKAIEEG
jgi:ERCC4-type nuclease